MDPLLEALRNARASDAAMPFPSGTPEALLQHNQQRSIDSFPKRTDPDPAAESSSETSGGESGGSTVDLTLCDGTIVRVSGYILSSP